MKGCPICGMNGVTITNEMWEGESLYKCVFCRQLMGETFLNKMEEKETCKTTTD